MNVPYFEIEIDKEGNLAEPRQSALILDFLNTHRDQISDLFTICHGWNNNMKESRSLYSAFFDQFCVTLDRYPSCGIAAGHCAAIGIQWPSEKFADPSLTAGGAAGLRDTALGILRTTTYRLMKHRAGVVGRTGLARAVDQFQTAFPSVRLHLIGHSFGCRAITAAASAVTRHVASMTLLQAAFSHNSFSPSFDSTGHPGFFRNVVADGKFTGPMVISHSCRDFAVGLAYPCVSRLLHQNASAIGGPEDVYGALGRNGARHTPEAFDGCLLPAGAPYSFAPGRIFNLRADDIILGHSDIVKPETAWAVISAAGLDTP